MDTYKYAHVAAMYAKNKDIDRARIALDLHAKKNDLEGKVGQGFIAGSFKNAEATMQAIQIESNAYSEKLAKSSVDSLIGSKFEDYFDGADIEKAKEDLGDALGMEYNDFLKMYGKAQRVKENEFGEESDEDIAKAQETLQKYSLIYYILLREQEKTVTPLKEEVDMIYFREAARNQYPLENNGSE